MGCYNSIVVNAPAKDVWSVLRNFHDISWSKNVISDLKIIGDKSENDIGAKRILNESIHETLVSLDDEARQLSYSVDDGPDVLSKDNVEGFLGKVSIFPNTENDTSFVVWTSNWDSAKVDTIADFCNPIYHALLQDLKNHFS